MVFSTMSQYGYLSGKQHSSTAVSQLRCAKLIMGAPSVDSWTFILSCFWNTAWSVVGAGSESDVSGSDGYSSPPVAKKSSSDS